MTDSARSTSSEPIVSIVTPSFNQGEFLDETVQSVLRQRGDFYLDYIVMDGGSTDGSVAIVEKYDSLLRACGRPQRIGELDFLVCGDPTFPWNRCRGVSYRWQSGPDGGQVAALKKAFGRCAGTLVGWINSDDYLLGDDALARVLAAHLADPEAMILTGNCSVVDRDGRELWKWAMGRIHLRECIYLDYHIPQSSTFFHRDLLRRYDLDPSRPYTFDSEFFVSILADGHRLVKLDEVLSAFRMHGENITDNRALKWRIFRERTRTLRRHADNRLHLVLAWLYQYAWYVVQPKVDPATRLGRAVTRAVGRYRELCYRTILGESYAQRYERPYP
jgi:glycosyltransferase involved in cell wall biosynthesis